MAQKQPPPMSMRPNKSELRLLEWLGAADDMSASLKARHLLSAAIVEAARAKLAAAHDAAERGTPKAPDVSEPKHRKPLDAVLAARAHEGAIVLQIVAEKLKAGGILDVAQCTDIAAVIILRNAGAVSDAARLVELGSPEKARAGIHLLVDELRAREPERFVSSPLREDLARYIIERSGVSCDAPHVIANIDRMSVEGRRLHLQAILRGLREAQKPWPHLVDSGTHCRIARPVPKKSDNGGV